MKKFFAWGSFLLVVTFALTAMFFSWDIASNPDVHIQWFGNQVAPTTLTERWAFSMLAGLIVTLVFALVFLVLAPLLLLLSGLILAACVLGLLFGLGGPILFVLAIAAVPLLLIGVPVWLLWFAIKKRPQRVIHESTAV